MSSNSCKR